MRQKSCHDFDQLVGDLGDAINHDTVDDIHGPSVSSRSPKPRGSVVSFAEAVVAPPDRVAGPVEENLD